MAAGAGVICAVGGAVAVTVAVVAGRSPGLTGYVSEAGVAASGYAATYRAGVFGLAAALLLIALALPAALRLAAALLTAGATATVVSGSVTCSDGCPLPPFERAGVADLVHGGASITAVAGCVFAMIVVAWLGPAAGPRRLSATAAAVALPVSATIGVAMLVLGRGPVVGLLERLLLADIALWATTLAAMVARVGRDGHRTGPHSRPTP